MPSTSTTPVDTRALFRPVVEECVALLRRLQPDDWQRPTVAGRWVVRDVVAHLIDVMLRRVSFHRDRMPPPPPPAIASERDFVAFINEINAQWVEAAKRLSPRVLTEMFEQAGTALSDWFEALPLDAPALFGVSWAGEQTSEGWFDVGREFVELWHHQQQIRMAVGAPSLEDPRFLHAVLAISLRALPHAYRDIPGTPGDTVLLDIGGTAGGRWTLTRGDGGWTLSAGEPATPTTRIALEDESAWRLLCNALPAAEAEKRIRVEGRAQLAVPLVRARAVIV